MLATVFRGIPDKVQVLWDREEALKAAKQESKELREDYDALSVTQAGEVVYSWPEND